MHFWGLLFILPLLFEPSHNENLTPPYFNLAEGKEIYASATCGYNTTGPELYCKLVGANSDQNEDINLIQGQVCDYCDPSTPDKNHPPEHAVDGMETWWQSPPLSRSMKYNEVNLTVNLGQVFHVAYVYVRMGNSPRPGLWVLEKSKDYGQTWSPWQYFSDSESDCLTYFGVDAHTPITQDDSVICTTEYSKIVPLEGGEIPISILNNRPSAMHYFNSTVLQEWTKATNVRFRFLRTKNLLGHLMSVARQDPTVTRRYFYSIKDISIGGRCMCNGHADTCDILDPSQPKKLVCQCQHNTWGPQCASCAPGFQQKKWQQSTTFKKFICEPCNCFGHSNECVYDSMIDEEHLSLDIHGNYEGGGKCLNCSHNTEGINCNRCKPKFYRPEGKPLNATDVCQPCNCNYSNSTGNCAVSTGKCECRKEFTPPNCDTCNYGYYGYPKCRPCDCYLDGTDGYHCEASQGSCPCKPNYAGHYCKLCAQGYYNFPECLPCACTEIGSRDNVCDVTSGNCTCKNNFRGRSCDSCEHGYYDYPRCTYCNCDARGTEPGVCDKENGRCLCKEGYGGARCDQCINGYYGYPNCRPCNCSAVGSSLVSCDATGKCSCLDNFAGRTCDQCSPGYYKYPECISCNCDSHGAIGVSCDSEGECQCYENFDGPRCDQCTEGYYNFPRCEGCNCDPAGVVKSFTGCGTLPAGELCQCKDRVEGRICNECKPLFWNLQRGNPDGCQDCGCHVPGVIGGIGECDPKSGQCICKPGVTSRDCSECVDGTFDLKETNLFGCKDCGCDIGGSVSNICNKETGQCVCQPRVTGASCNEPLQAHYFPTLHQFQYEVEDARTPSNALVRYGSDGRIFPEYSWKGYAVFEMLQNEIVQKVYIQQSSVYRMVLRFVNRNGEPVVGTIVIVPDNPSETEQEFKVQFKPSVEPAFVTVAGVHGNLPSPFVMNPGWWTFSISIKKSLFLDYFVLLPSEYYEATVLTEDVNLPCEIGYKDLCRHFDYPSFQPFDSVHGTGGFMNENGVRVPLREYFDDRAALKEVGVEDMPLINSAQRQIHFELRISKPGLHVLIITYLTSQNVSRTSTILIEANTMDKGKANLNPCRYTSLCRQVVTDRYGKTAVWNFPSNYASLVLIGEEDSDLAIDSIVAIPFDNWSLDYVKPHSVCVRKNGKCVQGMFPNPSDAKKIEFEMDNEVHETGTRPPGIYDNTTKLLYLKDDDMDIDIKTKVPQPGEYVFVVLYYQPDHPGFEVDVLVQNGKFYEAKLALGHCPSNSGCRGIITQADGNERFQLIENVVLSFKANNGASVWLDYILIVPADQYNEKVLKKIQFDQTKEFITRCGNNHFYIDVNQKGFCTDAVFSLTTNYNNGALPCHCIREGTTSFECAKFGGQCPCKENIIGRRCEICKTGFYGYPNCKPCNCPFTVSCHPQTGECICPDRVTGELCDQCESGTYGYHPIIGCEECNCTPLGVLNGDMQCDLLTGTCVCKKNVVGRTCDKCVAGYSQFPHCEKCDCDSRGTTADICDQYTAECYCKSNVQGLACDVCKEGTFNIQADNEDGCSKCFCFGKTTRCTSANLYKTYTNNMIDWDVVLVDEKTPGNVTVLTIEPRELNETSILVNLSDNEAHSNVVYFSAPGNYVGKRLTSYGGSLNYTVHYSTGPFGTAVPGADVILYGAGSFLLYYCDEQPPSFTSFHGSFKIVESNFLTTTNLPVTREQLLSVLEDLRGIYIRATYWEPSIQAVLSDVTLDEATESYSYNSPIVSSVEQCQCPPNYQGLSCEECAPGYYRVDSGPYGGYCVKCQCNGHAETCDVKTGVCHDCKNGTTGDHCEFCEQGYYGNATGGTPSDCLICACPLPVASNNFATSCEVNEDGDKIRCKCQPGYYGLRCQSCAAGYYGRPEVEGDFCKPCECSGNIDTNEIDACDSITGECLRCLNNTYGEACNLCAPGFFGDAVERKDCQSCLCDQCGMDKCDSYNGICQCKKNVVGEKCDRCEINHYGFSSCNGCEACDCGLASESSQCDETTGQCRCKPGVTGRKCDRCIAGYWNYGPEGCISCGCNTGYSIGASCNTTTGQCSCLPGVIGEKCDHCPYRYVLKEGDGCYECDSCIHDLLDVTDELAGTLGPVAQKFESVAESYFTNQRLKFINDTIDKLEPEVSILDPTRVNFVPLKDEIVRLEKDISNQRRQIEYMAEDSEKWKGGAENTLSDMNALKEDVEQEIQLVKKIVAEVQSLAFNTDSGTGAKLDVALKEAQDIQQQIRDVSFTKFRDAASDQSLQANILVSEMNEYSFPVSNLSSTTDKLAKRLSNFTEKIDDLFLNADKAEELVILAEDLINENKRVMEIGNFDAVKNSTAQAREDIAEGAELNSNATSDLEEAALSIDELRNNEIDTATEKLRRTIEQNDEKLLDIDTIVDQAQEHAKELYSQSLDLDNVLTDTRNTSAVRAVSAYRDIDETIKEAQADASEALQAANNASAMSQGVGKRTKDAHEKSTNLLNKALEALSKTKGTLAQDLQEAQTTALDIAKRNKRNEDALQMMDHKLSMLQPNDDSMPIDDFMQEAKNLKASINAKLERMNGIVAKIPEDLKATKQLSKDTADSIRDLSQVGGQMDSVKRVLPNIEDLLGKLGRKQREIDSRSTDLLKKIDGLKAKIANARELANRIEVGLTFFRNTSLELRNPESLPLLATATKLSLYFRTNKTNGFLLYLGNEDNPSVPRSKTRDFMALVIESGYPVLIMDLGSGPEKIINQKFVSDGIWRQIIVDRTGTNVKLIVREDVGEGKDKLYVKEQVIPGTYAIFNLYKDHSKLFVGGYPSSFQIQEAVTASSFEGQMEHLMVGDIPVSLWNFVHAENNRFGAKERDKLVDFAPPTGYRFDRIGYAIINMRAAKVQWDTMKFQINLKFKTFAEDGLIYLMKKDNQFLSLEMRNGRVVYQFDLGDGPVVLSSKDKFNNGEWHTIEAKRLKTVGVLEIDRVPVAKAGSRGENELHRASDIFYVGGHPPDEPLPDSVTRQGFDGCIDEIVMLDTSIDLSRNVRALGVMPGCPVKFASLVSFEEKKPGYVKWSNVTAENMLQINLKFKTTASNGLIFYATNQDQTANSFLSLVDGRLVFRSHGEELSTSSARVFNDNEWHVVTATHNEQALRLDIDDTDNYNTDFSPSPLNIVGGVLYIGGLPQAFGEESTVSKTTMPFVGCIGDTTLNGAIINYASTKDKPNAFLGKCEGGEQSPLPPLVETMPSNWPPPPITDEDVTVIPVSTQRNIVEIDTDFDDMNTIRPGNVPLEGRPREPPTQPPATTQRVLEEEDETTPRPVTPATRVDQCSLPYTPGIDEDPENAYRFGTVRHSRLEYRTVRGRYRHDYDFQIDLKTFAEDGIIFYSADMTKRDLIAVYLQEGKVNYKFDCGSGPAHLTSDKKINDNEWHTVVFKRDDNYGQLLVDFEPEITGYSQGETKTINVNPPFYVGGVLAEISSNVVANIGMNKSFSGCLGNFMMNGQSVGEPEEKVGVVPCSRHVEPGLFFYPGDGTNLYKALDRFIVGGRKIDIQMEIKPRSTSGHLLSIHGRRDYLLLEMVNGTIKFFVKTSKGPMETSFEPMTPHTLCDGQWHKIRAIKEKNVVLLSVDHGKPKPATAAYIGGVLTKHPVFIGGHPLLAKKLRGSTSHAQYVGCIRNIVINRMHIALDPERAYGKVSTGVCPTI